MAFERIQGLPDWRADLRIAQLCAIIANVYRDSRKRKKPFTAQDFMPDFSEKQGQTPDQQIGMMKMLAAAMGGRVSS